MNGAHFVVHALKEQNVTQVFGYPGGAIMPLYDALYDGGVEHLLCRHEQGAAMAAIGYARSTGKVGVCIATSGPGATNLITGLADALLDSVPIIAITGQVPTYLIGTDAFQEVDVLGLSLACTKHSFMVQSAEELGPIIEQAFKIATTGRPGPVLIESENSKIEWTDHTFNPWEGCQKVGPGCDHCYAENRNARFAGGQAINWGPGAPRRRTSVSNWNLPLRWNAQTEAFQAQHGRRQRVFCASLADVFDNAVSREWRDDLAALILDTADLDWLLLTKRIGNAGAMLGEMFLDGPPANVWLGATVVNQAEADRDIPKLLAVPARVRFLSMEPLLGPVNLERPRPGPDLDQGGGSKICQPWLIQSGIHWVIVGGESGPGARPMHPDWASGLRDQCNAAGLPFLFKQWGEWRPISQMSEGEDRALWRSRVIAKPHEDQSNLDDIYGRVCTTESTVIHLDGSVHHFLEPNAFPLGAMTMYRVGKKAAGRQLDGRTWDETPAT